MDVLHALLRHARELFHLSALDWAIAGLIAVVTFGGHVLRGVMMGGDVYLEFRRWLREFRRRCREIDETGTPALNTPPVNSAQLPTPVCGSCAARLARTSPNLPLAPARPTNPAGSARPDLARPLPAKLRTNDDIIDVNCGRCHRTIRIRIDDACHKRTGDCPGCGKYRDSR